MSRPLGVVVPGGGGGGIYLLTDFPNRLIRIIFDLEPLSKGVIIYFIKARNKGVISK